jgi:hypothetical protein
MKNESQIKNLLEEIEVIKEKMAGLGEIRPGTLTEQYNVCGNPSCRCKDKKNPKKHGPYYQLSYTRYGKSTSEFVKKENVDKVKKQIRDYKLFMKLKDEWIDLSIEIARKKREKTK